MFAVCCLSLSVFNEMWAILAFVNNVFSVQSFSEHHDYIVQVDYRNSELYIHQRYSHAISGRCSCCSVGNYTAGCILG